ncbi:MAG: NAD-dependent epimerase/dehydratase family protein [Acidobacteriota bacterium]|nr:NAD-dependent epimerase/dehydratase family protein [Acidobacteriota bacterium]
MPMKIVVTGATGFLGSHLCRRLVRDGHRVTILRRPTSNNSALSDLDLTHEIGDVTDSEAVHRVVEGNDVVVHAAAHLGYWGFQKEIQYKVNVGGTRNVVEACRRHGVRRLLHVSSVAAIGITEDPGQPAREDFPFNLEGLPVTYHISKKRAEEIVLSAVENGLDAVIVNPGAIWGPNGNQFRGAEIAQKVRHSSIVPYFTGGMCVVHVEDVVDGIIAALEHGKAGQRYILGGENLTLRSIAQMAARKQGLRRRFVPVPKMVTGLAAVVLEPWGRVSLRRPRITYATHYCASRFHYYDSSKARRELGYSHRDFKSILDECVSFTASRESEKANLYSSGKKTDA